tara:strand:- start:521 stop:949 length:429 start_codon:yes stop_codon:yes gene_type:complete
MLISCNSCNSKYLVNSAELKPDGRNVQCANCGNQWFQESQVFDDNIKEDLIPEVNDEGSLKQEKNKTSISNLPSTYVQEPKVSILNSILLVLFVILLIIFYWFFQKSNINSLVLIQFYINEFFFNLNMIINDIAKIIHQLIN